MTMTSTTKTPRAAIVTGGAAGVGQSIVRKLAREGIGVAIADRDMSRVLALELAPTAFASIRSRRAISTPAHSATSVGGARAHYRNGRHSASSTRWAN